MRALWNRFQIGWCRTFHPQPSWPAHGHYYCPACLRIYPVPWHEGDPFTQETVTAAPTSPRRGFVPYSFQKEKC